jgi:CRP-like cAMP-binding protein
MSDFQSKDTEILLKSVVLKGLVESEIKHLIESCEIKNFSKNEIILSEGEIGKGLFIILEGEVEAYLPRLNRKGVERISEVKVSKLKVGECFGEYSLIDEERISASIRSDGNDLRVCYISRHDFNSYSDIHHKAAKIIYKNLLELFIHRLRSNLKELDMVYVIH